MSLKGQASHYDDPTLRMYLSPSRRCRCLPPPNVRLARPPIPRVVDLPGERKDRQRLISGCCYVDFESVPSLPMPSPVYWHALTHRATRDGDRRSPDLATTSTSEATHLKPSSYR